MAGNSTANEEYLSVKALSNWHDIKSIHVANATIKEFVQKTRVSVFITDKSTYCLLQDMTKQLPDLTVGELFIPKNVDYLELKFNDIIKNNQSLINNICIIKKFRSQAEDTIFNDNDLYYNFININNITKIGHLPILKLSNYKGEKLAVYAKNKEVYMSLLKETNDEWGNKHNLKGNETFPKKISHFPLSIQTVLNYSCFGNDNSSLRIKIHQKELFNKRVQFLINKFT